MWKVDHSNQLFKNFCMDCKTLNNQNKLGKLKTMDSKAMLQAIEANLVSSTQRVSGELHILQTSVVGHFHDLCKSTQSWFVPHVTKILQNFWLTRIHAYLDTHTHTHTHTYN